MEPLKGISIPEPCHVPWDTMSPVKEGRFCSQCSKNVVDFSKKSLAQIRDYFLKNTGKRTCGRFRKDQLDNSEKEKPHRYIPLSPPLWIFAVAIFYAFGASLFDMDKHPLTEAVMDNYAPDENSSRTDLVTGIMMPPRSIGGNAGKEVSGIGMSDSTSTDMASIETILGLRKKKEKDAREEEKPEKCVTETVYLTGDSISEKSDPLPPEPDSLVVGVVDAGIPEFPGGSDSLKNFMVNHIRFPEKYQDSILSGRVIVKFTVDETGKVSNPIVLRSMGPDFDDEVLRVIRLLPDFNPGRVNGKPVPGTYMLPVMFKTGK